MKKTNNLIFIFTFLILTAGIFFLNKPINPITTHDLFYDNNLSLFSSGSDLLYTNINLTKNKKFEYVVLGGSAAHMYSILHIINKEYGNMALLNIRYASSLDLYEILNYFLKIHPEVKMVIVSLEYDSYIKCFSERTIKARPKKPFIDYIRVYLSVDTTKKALQEVSQRLINSLFYSSKDNQKPTLNIPNKENRNDFLGTYNEFRYYNTDNYTCDYYGISNLKKINNLLKKYNKKVVYFIPPCHANYISSIYMNNKYSYIENFKREIAQITPYYDMAYINYYTSKPMNLFLFLDVYHPNYEMLGKRILDCLFLNKIDKNLAVYITKDNVDTILNQQKIDLINYINKNKNYLKNYIEYLKRSTMAEQNEEEIPVYAEDIEKSGFKNLYLENVNKQLYY